MSGRGHRMLLYYHKDPLGNFGDDLNPWLWERLLPGWFQGEVAHDPRLRTSREIAGPLFIGIGTLLNQNIPAEPRKIVFGSGTGYGSPPRLDESWDILCVRGPITAAKLGLDSSLAVTDPAVLVREITLPERHVAQRVAFMPHCSSARSADWKMICANVGIGFIDPQWPVDSVLAAIRSCEFLVTEAMHGAIVADAMRIPWLAVSSSPAIEQSKWVDWSRSLGMEYRPIRLPALWKLPPDAGRMARLRRSMKTSLVQVALRRAVAAGRPSLSPLPRLDRAANDLKERLEKFKRRYPRT